MRIIWASFRRIASRPSTGVGGKAHETADDSTARSHGCLAILGSTDGLFWVTLVPQTALKWLCRERPCNHLAYIRRGDCSMAAGARKRLGGRHQDGRFRSGESSYLPIRRP